MRRTFVLVVVTVLALARLAGSQTSAQVRGRVLDPQGAVVSGAQITARSLSTGVDRTATTDRFGEYQLAALPPGAYRISVDAAGFQTLVVEPVTFGVADAIRDFQIQVPGLQERVRVAADASLVERATFSIGQTVDAHSVQYSPLNGRNILDLAVLTPGSVIPPQNGFLSSPSRAQGFQALNTAGNREDMVNVQINGITLIDQVNNILSFQPPLAVVDQFRIQNAAIGAEYGRNAGAVLDIVTRSGGDVYHGGGFEFARNSAFDARNFFETAKAPLRRHQFGGQIGGPIRSRRTFFFAAYEGLRQTQGLTVNSVVLSDTERTATTSAAIASLIALIPRSTAVDDRGTARFVGSAKAAVTTNRWALDMVQHVSDRDRLHGFFAEQRDRRPEPLLLGNTLPGFGDIRDGTRQVFTIEESRTIGSHAVNDVRAGFSRIRFDAVLGSTQDGKALGVVSGPDVSPGLPQINVAGAFNIGGPSQLPQGRVDLDMTVADTANVLLNRHALEFGGELRRFSNDNYQGDTGTVTFPSVSAFLADRATSFSIVSGERTSQISQGALSLFVRDAFRWKPSLTFDVGVRYDWHMTPHERDGRFVVFDPLTSSLQHVAAGNDVYAQNDGNVLPRLGVIWEPASGTVIRTGFTLHAEQPLTNTVLQLSANPPYATPLSIAGTVRLEDALALARAAGVAPITVDPDYRNSIVRSFNVSINRHVAALGQVMMAYVGSRGSHLRLTRNINQPIDGVRPFIRLSESSAIEPGRPLGNITQIESSGSSRYDALWWTADRPLRGGLQVKASYVWSKSIDTNSLSSPPTVIVVQNGYDIAADRGLSDFDARHRVVMSGIYSIPSRHPWLADWHVSFVFQAQSGNPVNLVTNNSTLTGVPNTVRPNVTGPIRIIGDVSRWFDTSVFSAAQTFGNLGRNVVIGPGFSTTDVSLSKRIRLTRGASLDLRAEAFNLFNRPNFGLPGRIVGTADFGRVTNTRFSRGDSGSSRQLQFSTTVSL